MNKISFLISRCSWGGKEPSTTSRAVPVQCVRPRQAQDAREPEDRGPRPGGSGHLQKFRRGFLEEAVLCMADLVMQLLIPLLVGGWFL